MRTHHFQNKSSRIISNILISAVMGKILGTRCRVPNSHGKCAIGVQATEVILYILMEKY